MPEINFVLPHWFYWGTLILFPLIAMAMVAREKKRTQRIGPSLFVAYLFWLTGGFIGLHRIYLRNVWALIFLPVVIAILYSNTVTRDHREDVSRLRSAYETAQSRLNRAKPIPGLEVTPGATARFAQAQANADKAKADYRKAEDTLHSSDWIATGLAILLGLMLVGDALLLPGLFKRVRAEELAAGPPAPELIPPEVVPQGTHEDPTAFVHTPLTNKLDAISTRVGEFVAYWAILSVFAYYYEVVGRYFLNSPTNWVHESMFLMFGMQYMLSGAYGYLSDQHVRVDVFYSQFSVRGKAIADIFTSIFFFIFVGTMLWTGYNFAADATRGNEMSFTEWGVQYWPVKLTLPIGAALLLLQGISKLIKDIIIVSRTRGVSHGS
ncbi:MAG TPA: TRAP transporter small permease subunit [Xanthobacteraceae bacterium]|nr:TRAP transporter small permease subunit [Xanthobacteraceae bacterium]